ncbi:GNAT family N-acetyltransferase [Paenibacillus sp. GCM10012306]|uniref:GNAT family N-acetyltransferase n=1 Tax=Paenibacillus sp. GCM10012306 TaxID=3317342 RepID=UPI00360DFDE9
MSLSNSSEQKVLITIRSAVPADYESVVEVLSRAWESYAVTYPEVRESLKETLRKYLEPGSQERIVAEAEGLIVGTAELFHTADEAYGDTLQTIATPVLRRLAVLPGWQGKGIATRLIQESAKRAWNAGAGYLYLHTSLETNASAARLYEHLGFVRSSDQDLHLGENFMEGFRLDLPAEL